MHFTYQAYGDLLELLRSHGYACCSYDNWKEYPRCVILRHDIDNDIGKALTLAKLEKELGVSSTYFVLVTSDFYNVFSAKSGKLLRELSACGHSIGLHFDEVRYPEIKSPEDAQELILQEANLLSQAAGVPITSVSMHRPSKMMLEADLKIPGMVNSYGKTFFKDFKYLSDSRRRWREPVEEIVSAETFDRLHILTHAIWYQDSETDIHDTLAAFIRQGNAVRYEAEKENITDLDSILYRSEIER